MREFRKGDRVTWESSGGTAQGKVVRKQTSDTHIKGHTVRASPEDPQFIVRSDHGGQAAHKPTTLHKP